VKFVPSEPQQILIDHILANQVTAAFVGMGIGKTGATLYALNELFLNLEIRGALVVAPLRVASITWPNEISKFSDFRWMKAVSLRTKEGQQAFMDGSAQLYLVNYDYLPKLTELFKRRKGPPPWDVEVWDEISKAKSHDSKRINGFRKLPRAPRRIGLTGTPAAEGLMGLFSQIRLLDDGAALGTSFTRFRERYMDSDFMGYVWTPKPFAREAIQKAISHLTVTLSSSDWLSIPDTHTEDLEIELPNRDGYKKLKREMLLELKDKTVTAANAAVLIGKLQQYTSGALYTEDGNFEVIHDAKLDALEKLHKKLKKPLLVSCCFRHEQARIRERIPEARFFEDAKTAEQQVKLVADWNANKIPMLVAHPASIGHGLNLQEGGADTIVWVSLTFSRELYLQMNARLARRGQQNVTTIVRLLCPDTVDEAVVEALREKETDERSLLSALRILESQKS
jgi:SNF2 family DNA or RNA helicase